MQACLQQTVVAQNQVETTKREMTAMMDSKMVDHMKHFTDLINVMRSERQSAPEVDARTLRRQQRKEAQEAKEQARRNDSRPRRDRSRPPPVIKNLLTADGDDRRHPRGGDARGRTPERPPKPKAPARPKAKAHSANPTMKTTASATTPRTLPRNALQSAPKSLRPGGPPGGIRIEPGRHTVGFFAVLLAAAGQLIGCRAKTRPVDRRIRGGGLRPRRCSPRRAASTAAQAWPSPPS